jgi:hypothetical protein
VKKKNPAVKRKRGKMKRMKKRNVKRGRQKRTPRKATVYKTAGKGKEKRVKTCRKGFKFHYLSSDEEENAFCLMCCEKYATNEEWVHCTECVMWAHWGCAGRDPRYVYINCQTDASDKWG